MRTVFFSFVFCLCLFFSCCLCVTDVCVLGAGASGMSAAALAKDNGLSVKVFESSPRIGGHCHTVYSTPDKTDPTDIGVQFIRNKTALGIAFDIVQFVRRFAGSDSIIPVTSAVYNPPTYLVYFPNGTYYGPPSPPGPDFLDALQRYVALLQPYPWLDTADVPPTIPPILRGVFSDFIINNNLTALSSIFNTIIVSGGYGSFDKLSTLYGVLAVPPSELLSFLQPTVAFFSVKGGCVKIYQGIQAYLTAKNVITNARLLYSSRSTSKSIPSTLVFLLRNTQIHIELCKKIIVAFSPTLDQMQPLALDAQERRIFRDVRIREYFTSALQVTGGVSENTSFVLSNTNQNNQFHVPDIPGYYSIRRTSATGLAQGQASSDTPITDAAMLTLVNQNIAGALRSELLNSITLNTFIRHQGFGPYFVAEAFLNGNNPYPAFKALQGRRNTWYTGALTRRGATSMLYEQSFKVVQLIVNTTSNKL